MAPVTWLVTGAAGFIGSHLVQALLEDGQRVVGLDNFATGLAANLDEVRDGVTSRQWGRFTFIEGDVRDADSCARACDGIDVVLHQAALGSVPRSLAQPLATHETNVTGLLNVLVAARDAGVRRVVYASSSSVYGDHPEALRREGTVGRPLSPYAASKLAGELYAHAFGSAFALECVGLRYFNVFGPRQDSRGPYAAVLARWVDALLHDEPVFIHGDGLSSRDFCYVANVVRANLLAAAVPAAAGKVFNVGGGNRTALNQLFDLVRDAVARHFGPAACRQAVHDDPRRGDVRHSVADIGLAREVLGYAPAVGLAEGLREVVEWRARRVASPLQGAAPA
jgi:UDP-N-acetylglucosamine 4-epimerase